MITYDQIKSANERVETIELKGKRYAYVAARVQAFRELCPNGCISTDIDFREDSKGSFVVCKTTVFDESGQILATGMAYEREGSNQVNRTSYIENCETSAVGRALGMLGLGSQTSMASAEEMANALFQQSKADEALDQATYVDMDGEHSAEEEADRIYKDIVMMFYANGKTEADAVAWLEKVGGRPVGELSVGNLRNAKLALINRSK